MPIDLTQYESGLLPPTEGSAVAKLQERLGALQLAQIVHGRRAIVLFEGWEGSGRRTALRRLAGAWDPCHFATYCGAPGAGDRHWLAPYWQRLPGTGDSSLYCESWYHELVGKRLAGTIADKQWPRRCDEINEFEAQQQDHGTLLIKLFFHVTAAVQAERVAALSADPWLRFVTPHPDAGARASSEAAWTDLLSRTDTRWAPWTVIDANGPSAGLEAALEAITAALAKTVPLDPPASEAPVRAASAG